MNKTLEGIRTLREQTGAGVLACRNALQESAGDVSEAKEQLRKKGFEQTSRRSADADEGRIGAYVHHDGTTAAMVELNCETDFAARTVEFGDFVMDLARHAAAMKPESVDEFLAQELQASTAEGTVKQELTRLQNQFKEVIELRRFVVYELGE